MTSAALSPPSLHDDARARVGTCIGGLWRLDALLGVGGTGRVYAATHADGRRGALKLIRFTPATTARAKERARREASAANLLADDGAVRVIEHGVEGDELFLVMELLEGESLAERARAASGVLPLTETLRVVERMLAILATAHARGLVHRDVKPENVFLTTSGEVRLLDFGFARLAERVSGAEGLTQSGVTLGTPAFMAPEQARGRTREISPRTDVWAVGATVFTLLTGRFVHSGETVGEVVFLAGSVPAPSLASCRGGVPGVFAEVVDRALAFRPGDRYADAAAMLGALAEARIAYEAGDRSPREAPTTATTSEEVLSATRSLPPPNLRGRPARWGIVGSVALAALVAGVGVAGRARPSAHAEPAPAVANLDRTDATPTTPPPSPLAIATEVRDQAPAPVAPPTPLAPVRRAPPVRRPVVVAPTSSAPTVVAPVTLAASADDDMFEHRK